MDDERLKEGRSTGADWAGHEKTAIQRQIEATDRQIENLVYELYGLTEDEIKIVEEALSPSNIPANPDPVLS